MKFSPSLLLKELSVLLKSGLPLPRALELLSRRKSEEAKQILEIKTSIERGEDIVRAFRQSKLFPEYVCEMLIAAQTGESLEKIFSKASDLLSRMEEFGNRVTGALIYPALVMGFSILSVVVVLEFIVPKLRKILLSFGRDLPLLTKVLLWGAKFLWWFMWLGLPIGLVWGIWWVKRKGWREVHRLLLKIPVAGTLWLYFDLSRWSYTTALLLEAGVVLPRAVATGGNSCQNLYVRESLREVTKQLEEGQALSGYLRRYRFIPEFLVELVAIGEESGTLPEMLHNVSEIMIKEADYLIERTLRWLEPLTILFIGLVVAYIIISVILPIMEISSAVKL